MGETRTAGARRLGLAAGQRNGERDWESVDKIKIGQTADRETGTVNFFGEGGKGGEERGNRSDEEP